eukprot:16036582-Heterocapsa_arctica.AAC.1
MSRPGAIGAVREVFGHSRPEFSARTCLGKCRAVSPHARVSNGCRWKHVCRHTRPVFCCAHTQ